MKKYIVKRLLTALGIVLFVILLNYVIIHLAPGDPVRIMAGFDNPSQEQMDALTQKYGLDQPLHVQFWKYISALFRGDMGISYQYNEPVAQLILERVGASLLLSGTAAVLAVVIGCLLITVIANGLDIMGVSSHWQKIVKGVIIVVAVLIDVKGKTKKN